MNDTTLTPELNTALAKVQAQMPAVAKDSKGVIDGRDGRRGYSYDYADLAACTAAILPLLGANGLAFTGCPGLNADGQFGLAYELAHESGQAKHGFWPLPTSGTPQQIGAALTYARRYCLCTITGLAPGGDDNDAAGAERQDYERRPSEPDDDDETGTWQQVISEITCPEDADRADADLRDAFRAGKIGQAKARRLRAAIAARKQEVTPEAIPGGEQDRAGFRAANGTPS